MSDCGTVSTEEVFVSTDAFLFWKKIDLQDNSNPSSGGGFNMSDSIILYPEEILKIAGHLNNEDLGILFLALCSFACGKETPKLEPAIGIAFELMKNGIRHTQDADGEMADEPAGIQKKPAVPKDAEAKTKKKAIGDADALFTKLWTQYPNKKGKGKISDAKKRALLEIGEEHMLRAIRRYIAEHEAKEKCGEFVPCWQNGSTFFNSGYVDYLDENYAAAPRAPLRASALHSAFYCYQQSDTDWDEVFFQTMLLKEKEMEERAAKESSKSQ